jgi:hypothetical protein
LSKNALLTKETGKVLGDMLKGNSILKELDVSSNYDYHAGATDGPGFAEELSDGIKDNGVLLSLSLASNNLGELVPPEGWERSGSYYRQDGGEWTEAVPDGTKPQGIIAIANVIPDMRALSSVNVLSNVIPVEQAQELVKIMRAKKNLTTFCGLSGEEAELDFSGQDLGAGDAVLIANDISDMGALTSLNLSSNSIGAQWKQGKMVVTPEGIFVAVVTFGSHVVFYVGPVAIADAIRDMGALTSLNLASNDIGGCEDEEGYPFITTPEGRATLYCAYPTYCFSYRC